MDTRKIIDYAQDGNAVGVRESLYASIWDRVHAAIESKKQEIAQTLVAQESYEGSGDDEEDEYVASVRKNMAKRDAEKAAKQTAKTANKQLPGGSRASDKLAKESYEGPGDDEEDDWDEEDEQIEEETLNEIGDTPRGQRALKSYYKKGVEDLTKTRDAQSYASQRGRQTPKMGQSPSDHPQAKASLALAKQASKRMVGLDRAAARIAKESYDDEDPNAHKLVQDRKTGKWYDPNKEFENIMKSPEVKAQMKRMAQKTTKESYDDDEDPDVRIADKELKKRGVTLPKVKVDPDKDMARLAKRTPKEKEED